MCSRRVAYYIQYICTQIQPYTTISPDASGTLSNPTLVIPDNSVLVITMSGTNNACPSVAIPATCSDSVTVDINDMGGIQSADITVGPNPGQSGAVPQCFAVHV